MSEIVTFKEREPIGSSTYPMPNEEIHWENTLTTLAEECAIPERKTSTLYLHIPFCDQICSFCGFNKFVSPEDKKEAYVRALLREIELYGEMPYVQSLDIQAVYLGGGTPNSLSPNQLEEILRAIQRHFPLNHDCEITCEGTPQNFTLERIAVLQRCGVNRVSAGIQTFDLSIRQEHLNMREGKKELLEAIERIQSHFSNFNLDLIYNLPRQTEMIWKDDLETVLSTRVQHLTLYPLVLLEKTAFYWDFVRKNKYPAPDQENEISLFTLALNRLNQTEFKHRYSVRDWAKEQRACRYITLNAKAHQIVALGAGAHGYVAKMTYRNLKDIKSYCERLLGEGKLPFEAQRFCTDHEEMQRYMVMGLRLLKLDMTPFHARFGRPWEEVFGEKVDTLVRSGYLQCQNNALSFTSLGYVWGNNVRTFFEGARGISVGYTDTLGIGKTGKDHYSAISRIKAAADVEAHH